jgi:hypothetical protein
MREKALPGDLLSILRRGSYRLHIGLPTLLKHHFGKQWMKHFSMTPYQDLWLFVALAFH